jgi:hypothetical protein
MKTKVLFAALVAALILTGSAKAEDWQELSRDGYSILMPGTPATQEKDIPSPAGNLKMKMHIASNGDTGVVYMIASVDLPAGGLGAASADDLLDGTQAGMIQGINGKLISQSKVTNGRLTGRDIRVDAFEGKGTLRGQLFAVNGRIYMLAVLAPKSVDASADTGKFLDSFKVND